MKNLLVILLAGIPLVSPGSQENFEAANHAYADGNYSAAIDQYIEILSGSNDGKLHYNLGNAYYKSGDFPRAILHYEKALRSLPNDKDIIHNLKIANLQVIDKIEATPEFFLLTWWKNAAKQSRADRWAVLFLVVLWITALCFLAFAFSGMRWKRMLFSIGVLSMACALVLLLLTFTQHKYETASHSAIIYAPSVSIKSAPLNSGTDLFIIHEGLKVRVLDNQDGWYRIRLADGKEGWLPEEMAMMI